MNKIMKQINSIITNIKKDTIIPENNNFNLLSDANFDSLMMVMLIIEIENEFSFEFDESELEIESLSNYYKLVEMISKKLKK